MKIADTLPDINKVIKLFEAVNVIANLMSRLKGKGL